MSKAFSDDRLHFIGYAFLLSVVLGPAASYSVIYLFHIVLAAMLAWSFLSLVAGRTLSVPRTIRWDVAFFLFFLGWYLLSVLWAADTVYALRYCVYVALAVLTIFYTFRICDTLPRLRTAFLFLAIAFAIEIFLSVLESARVLRLPFSAYSPYQVYFGRQPNNLDDLNATALDYISSMPTGFFGNPNNLSAFLVLILPFFLLHKRWSVKLVGAFSILFIIHMAGARAALVSYAAVVLLTILFHAGNVARLVTISSTVSFLVLGTAVVDAMKESEVPRIAEVGTIGVAVRDLAVGLFTDTNDIRMDSTGARVQLIKNGLEALAASYGLGVGAGGSHTVQEMSRNQPGELTSMHNFWIEILVDAGIGFALVFMAWYISFLWRLWVTGRHSSEPLLAYCAQAFFLGFAGFILGAVGPSSVIYMLPMWMLIGIALATIHIESRRRRPSVARPHSFSRVLPKFSPHTGSAGAGIAE